MTPPRHVPVMRDRVVDLLVPALTPRSPGSAPVVVDATLGLGGHSEALLERVPGLRLVGIDRDQEALRRSADRLATYGDRVHLVHAVYDQVGAVLGDLGIASVQGVLFDLGVSSMQLDVRHRGFAYAEDAPLDMRMDDSAGPTAADVLNTYSVGELTRVLAEYGEERFAGRIAARVVREREREPFTASARLVELVRDAIPAPARRTGGHPAKRTFQALRIEVNDELGALRRALPAAVDALDLGGRVVVMSYHSLEDRTTKRFLARHSTLDVPPDMPVVPDEAQPLLRLLTRGAEQAEPDEVAANPRARSVRVRAAERTRPGAVTAPGSTHQGTRRRVRGRTGTR
jgi:16S rRNA (cytosine1402-N4)-methyltransferase